MTQHDRAVVLEMRAVFDRPRSFPDKPRELENTDVEEREFWRQVRRSPTRTARDIRLRLKDIDRRLADIESYVTTENRSLAREIEQLR